MSKKNIFWSSDGRTLPDIERHTKAKHQILEDYVSDWIFTLCGNNIGLKKTVTLIDGFCGGGMYHDENHKLWCGSPIRLINAVERGLERVKKDKSKPDYELNVKYIFIDNQQSHLDCLKKQMINSGLECYVNNSELCSFVCAKFETIVDKLIGILKTRKGSSLFFLGPFGYSDVSMQSIRKIIGLRKTEIIYTFMIDFIKRFLKLRNEYSYHNVFYEILESDGYFNLTDLTIDTKSQNKYIRNESLRLFRDRGKAPYVYSFALLPKGNTVLYYLIHLASSPTAQKVIKKSLWKHNNIVFRDLVCQFDYDICGLGFKTAEYYSINQRIFDIHNANNRAAIENLTDDLMKLIHFAKQIDFRTLHNSTMQFNPATEKHYMTFIDEQRDAGEIEVLRNGKRTKSKNIKPTDFIVKPQYKQLTFIDINKYKNDQKYGF